MNTAIDKKVERPTRQIASYLSNIQGFLEPENDLIYEHVVDVLVQLYNGIPTPKTYALWKIRQGITADDERGVSEALARRISDEPYTVKLIEQLYVHYQRYDRIVGEHIVQYEGEVSSYNKSGTLLSEIYPAWLLGKQVSGVNVNYGPAENTYDSWCALVAAFHHFDSGDFMPFFAAHKELQQRYAEASTHHID